MRQLQYIADFPNSCSMRMSWLYFDMRHDRGVSGLIGHLDRCERLGEGADLVDLDEDRVGATVLDAVGKPFHIGNEEIIADQLALAADQVGEFLPAIHV